MSEISLLHEITAVLAKQADAIPEQSKMQFQFARFQIKYIRNLVEGFLILDKESKAEVAGCLARPAVEAYLNLKASLTDPLFAASKCIADLDQTIKLDEVRKAKCPFPDIQARLQTTNDAAVKTRANLMNYHKVPNVRRWNAKEIAEVADLVAFYDGAYSTFHPAIHANLDGHSIEASRNSISLVVFHLTTIALDTFALAVKEFAPEKMVEYLEQLKDWRTRLDLVR